MARDIRNEQRGETEDSSIQDAPQPISSIQIPMTPEMQKTIVQIVREDHNAFSHARERRDYGQTSKGERISFKKWMKDIRDLYNARREPKTIPWKFCSNRSLRITASIVDMLHARLYSAVVNEELVRWRPGGTEDFPKVERITKFMHWWAWVRSRLRHFYDPWIKSVIGYGSILTESTWKVKLLQTGNSINEPVNGEDGQQLVNSDGTPSVVKGFEPDRIESSASKIFLEDQFMFQEGSMDISEEPVIIEEDVFYRVLEDGEAEGKFLNVTDKLREMIPVGREMGSNLSPEEAERVRTAKLRNHPVKIVREYLHFDADGDGFAEDIRVYVSLEHDLYLGGIAMKSITKSGKRPLTYTKFEDRLEHPQRNWGIGIVEKVRELAEEIDAIFNQVNDGNTLSVMNPVFYDPGGDIDAPVLKLQPNRMTPVSDPTRNIYFPPINIPTEKLLNAIKLILEFIERLTAASSFVLGKQDELAGGSGTATRTNAIVSAAEQRFALPGERLREGASAILTNHLDLVQLNIQPGLETRIMGENGEPLFGANELSQQGIASEMDAYLLADPSEGSKSTERELAGMFYSILLQNVIVGTDPAKIYKITADLLKAYGKDPKEYLGPEPDYDMIDSPQDENTLLVQGDFTRVKAIITENHIEHIRVHQDLINSPSMAELAQIAPHLHQQVMQALQIHIQEHTQMMQVMISIVGKFGGGGSGAGPNESGNEGSRGAGTDSQGLSTIGGQPGLEQTSGPLGQALESKRTGKVGGNPAGPGP